MQQAVQRLAAPVAIDFRQAILVAVLGLGVNVASARLLRDDHHHGHDQGHDHHHGHHKGDNNLRAAYVHVIADALTSVLAIAALTLGSIYGWLWLDPQMGIVGALVLARWSWNLIRDAGGVLLDSLPPGEELPDEIRSALEDGGETITDLHVWQLGPGHDLSHVTVDVEPALAHGAESIVPKGGFRLSGNRRCGTKPESIVLDPISRTML